MNSRWLAVTAGVAAAVLGARCMAGDSKAAEIAKKIGMPVEAVTPSPVSGLYEVRHNHEFGYVSEDGTFMLQGDLINLRSGEEITEEHRRADRVQALHDLAEGDFITFAPTPASRAHWVVTVFTDVDCQFCRLLHKQVTDYNRLGITIRYAAYPRSGPDSPSFEKAEQVWCSSDRARALTQAKQDKDLSVDSHCKNPVAKEYALGRDLGLRGTPMLILPNGERVDGYRSPEDLEKMLKGMDPDNTVKVSLDH